MANKDATVVAFRQFVDSLLSGDVLKAELDNFFSSESNDGQKSFYDDCIKTANKEYRLNLVDGYDNCRQEAWRAGVISLKYRLEVRLCEIFQKVLQQSIDDSPIDKLRSSIK